ncbi:hypothetical protein P3L10_004262 [Capsicum annuum]|uniref:uncharacterized protein LOC107857745 n=1 Tax=Capsicum annuum TaxID=4072 RepID=UPI001FB141D8|nr:uncharacterized protein LOC107857745 [Capsicum annuum]
MNEPLNDGLFEEHHEIQDGCTEEEYETEETEEEDEEREFEEDIDNMTRGGHPAGKSTGRSKAANRVKIPSIPAPVIEQDDTSFIPTMPPDQTPVIPETSPILPNQSSPIGQNMNVQSNTAVEATFSQRNVSASRLEPSSKCSSSITLSFKSEVNPNGINWKGVSQDVKDGYFGEFKKNFYWDASVSEVLWMELWQSDDCVKKSEINSKNRCGGHEVADGTHIGGSITAGEHRKKLLLLLLCYFFSKQLLQFLLFFLFVLQQFFPATLFFFLFILLLYQHERYEEIIREKVQCESEIDQLETYYEVVGGAKKKRLFGLGSETTSYFGKKQCACNASTSSVPPSISLPTTNMEELVKQFIPALTTHFLPIVIERVGGTRVQDGVVLDPPPTHDDDDDVDS